MGSTQHKWSTVNMNAFVPDSLLQLVSSLNPLVSAFQVYSQSTQAASLLVPQVAAPVDVLNTAFALALQAIDQALISIVATQLSYTQYVPVAYGSIISAPLMFGRLADSFFDENDPARPVNTGTEMDFFLWVGVAQAESIKELHFHLEALISLFGGHRPALGIKTKSFLEDMGGYPPKLVGGEGMKPDWETMKLSQMGEMGQLIKHIQKVRSFLAVPKDTTSLLLKQLELIATQLAKLQDLLQQMTNTLQRINELQANMAGLHSLAVYGKDTLHKQVEAMQGALQKPDSPLDERDLAVGLVAVHIQSNIPSGVNLLRSLFSS